MKVTLMDGEERNRAHPKTFEIPSVDERRGLRRGDYAKVGFEFPQAKPNYPTGERIWIAVTRRVRGGYRGKVANRPVFVPDLQFGEEVGFRPEHVLAVMIGDHA